MKKEQIVKTGVVLLFIGLLAVPAGIKKLEELRAPEQFKDHRITLERYGFYLEEVSQRYGIDFVHQRPDLDPKLEHILPQIASIGASVSLVDFNNDGLLDIYLTN